MAGAIAGLTIMGAQINAAIDDNPDTQPNVEAIIAAAGLIGLGAAARDNDKSSEQVGAK